MAAEEKKAPMHEVFNKGERKIIFGGVEAKEQKVLLPGHRAQVSHKDAEKLKALFPYEIEVFEK